MINRLLIISSFVNIQPQIITNYHEQLFIKNLYTEFHFCLCPFVFIRGLLFLLFNFAVFPNILILPFESLNSPPGVDNLLLPSKQGVTLRTYLDGDLFSSGISLEFVPAGTMNNCLLKGWMNIFFHCFTLHLSEIKSYKCLRLMLS